MTIFDMLIAIIAAAGTLAFAINILSAKDRESQEPLGEVEESALCGKARLHKWDRVVLLKPSDLETYKSNPSKYPETTFCLHCGYCPGLEKQVKLKFLKPMQEAEMVRQAALERERLVETLKKEWLAGALVAHAEKSYSSETAPNAHTAFEEGFKSYDRFVAALPGLIAVRNK